MCGVDDPQSPGREQGAHAPGGARVEESGTHALRESEDRFRLLVESVVDYGIFMLDLSGHITSWNLGARRMKQYTEQEILGKHFSIFYPPDEVEAGKCDRELVTAAREGRFEEEGWRLRKDGSRFWANVVITPLRDRTGRMIGYAKVTRDLTERRNAEDDLRRSEERLRLLIASVRDYAIFVLDTSGHVASWNAGAERLKGYAADEIIGQHFSRFYPEHDVQAGKCEFELAEATRVGRFEDEGWRIRKDGTRFWANVVITPIRDAHGVLRGFAKVTRDLSERKRYQDEQISLARAEEGRRIAEENQAEAHAVARQLRAARDKAEEATRLKDDFLATVSHELRTPLNAILGWGSMLDAGKLDPEKTAHAIGTIVRNAKAQSQIIDDLLDVSRIIAGQLRLDVDQVDINQIVSGAVDVVRPAADARGVSLHWDGNPDAGVVKGDAGRLQQVLWNLLSNAVKFTPRGGSVRVSLRRHESSIEIEIADTGEGIAPEFLPRVFERFSQQEANNSRKAGGLGLGLAIVKHLVELHGGTVEAQSKGPGTGATFTIALPPVVVRRPKEAARISITPAAELQLPAELVGLKVLVVDDEADGRELVQAVLERAGAVVSLASSVVEALDAIRVQRPDAIVSDIGMPGEDGYAFIQKLRALPREEGGRIPAVALTAFARGDDRRKALLAGFQNHAAKPIEAQELMVVVANLAGRYA
jgi:PAS domain S-box-containing protein